LLLAGERRATGAATIGTLAGATLVLGIVWRLRERDDRPIVTTQ